MAWVSDKDCYFLCKDNFLWTNFMRIVFPADMKSAFLTICSSRTANWAKLKAQVFDRLSRCRLRAKRLLSCLFKRAAGRWKSPILRLSTFNLTLFVVLSELSPVFGSVFLFSPPPRVSPVLVFPPPVCFPDGDFSDLRSWRGSNLSKTKTKLSGFRL